MPRRAVGAKRRVLKMHSLVRHRAHVRALAFSVDGTMLASIDADGTLVLWSLGTMSPIGEVALTSPYAERAGRALAFFPSGELLVSWGGGIAVLEPRTLRPVRHGPSHQRPKTLTMADGGRFFLGDDATYDPETLTPKAHAIVGTSGEYAGFHVSLAHVATDAVLMCDDGGSEDVGLATQGPLDEKRLRLYASDLRTERRARVLPMGQGIYEAAFDPKTRRFVFDLGGQLVGWSEDGAIEAIVRPSLGTSGALYAFGETSVCVSGAPLQAKVARVWSGCFEGEPVEVTLGVGEPTFSGDGRWVGWVEYPVEGRWAVTVVEGPLGWRARFSPRAGVSGG